MRDAYTIEQIRADETLIRQLAGRLLNGPRGTHKTDDFVAPKKLDYGTCMRCSRRLHRGRWTKHGIFSATAPGCPTPDPAEGSLPDIAEALVKKCDREKLRQACLVYTQNAGWEPEYTPDPHFMAEWFAWAATPAERCACCLLALLPGKVTI